jgi:hypothetical protein
MNPMAYRGPGQTLVGYEPPPAWSPPTPEQESLREPWIDPTTAFAGGFGANIMRRGLMGALRGGTAAAIADYPLGLATAGVENIDPRLAMPFNIMGGMASGASFERGLENAMAGRAHPVRTARRALGNAMGQVDVWHGSPHSFDRFSMDKIGTGEGHQAFGHGLYFTDLVDVAKHYAKTLNQPEQILVSGKSFTPGNYEITQIIGENRNSPQEIKQKLAKYIERSGPDNPYSHNQDAQKIIDAIDNGKFSVSGGGQNLYKATLHKGKHPSEYVYLDWDKPVSTDTAERIKSAIGSQGTVWQGTTISDIIDDAMGGIFSAREEFNRYLKKLPSDELRKIAKKMVRAPEESLTDGTFDAEWARLAKEAPDLDPNIIHDHQYAESLAPSGGDFYHALTNALGSDKKASLTLLGQGIDGIRYPSGSLSGGSGKGKNYVVFDENAITIEERKALGR